MFTLFTKKNIVYYSKDKQKIEGTKYESTAQQKAFLTKKVVEDEKIKKKRVRKVLTDEEKMQAKEARRIKKLDKRCYFNKVLLLYFKLKKEYSFLVFDLKRNDFRILH